MNSLTMFRSNHQLEGKKRRDATNNQQTMIAKHRRLDINMGQVLNRVENMFYQARDHHHIALFIPDGESPTDGKDRYW